MPGDLSTPHYLDIAEARAASGLRVVVSKGVPGPWSESAKKIFEIKGVPYQLGAQHVGQANDELVAWAGVRNAPVVALDDGRPLTGWAEILMLAENLAPQTPLLPADPADRATAFGISNEICGEWGFGWCRRLLMYTERGIGQPPPGQAPDPLRVKINGDYGVSAASLAAAPERVAAILRMLAARLHAQRDAGSAYLVGAGLTACDVYWACFSMMIKPLPAEVCPMPQSIRDAYTPKDPRVVAEMDPILFAHRDRIYADHIKLPLTF